MTRWYSVLDYILIWTDALDRSRCVIQHFRFDASLLATPAIDFGPGGLSGIRGLTARNLEGRRARVLVIGGKEKNRAEVDDACQRHVRKVVGGDIPTRLGRDE